MICLYLLVTGPGLPDVALGPPSMLNANWLKKREQIFKFRCSNGYKKLWNLSLPSCDRPRTTRCCTRDRTSWCSNLLPLMSTSTYFIFFEPNGLPTLARLFLQLELQQVELTWKRVNKQTENVTSFTSFFVPLREHLGDVILCPRPRHLWHCTSHMPFVQGLLPLLSKQLGILFFLCLPTGLFARGGRNLNPISTLAHWDLSVSGLMTPPYASLKW